MGIERIVTDETVFEAADSLAAAGRKVTNRAIWTAIGGGSMTTISQALRHWREQQELRTEQPIERAVLPAEVADVMHDAVARLWQAAQAETKVELDQLTQAMNARVGEAQGERDEALAELQSTVEELEQVKAERDEARAEIERQEQQLAASAGERDRLNSIIEQYVKASDEATHRADTAEAARDELQARVAQLSALLEREQAAHAKAETEGKASGEQCAELRARLDAGERRAAEIETRASIAEQAATQARRETETARIAEQASQARLEAATREIEGLRADKADAEDRYRRAADSAARWQGRLEALGTGGAPVSINAGDDVEESVLKWLTGTPASDVNFKTKLESANAATLRAALEYETLTKAARKAIEAALRKLA